MKNICHCLNYQNENAVPLKQDGFFLKLLEHHHHTAVCTCYAEGDGSITLALSPQPGGKSDYYSHSEQKACIWLSERQKRKHTSQGPPLTKGPELLCLFPTSVEERSEEGCFGRKVKTGSRKRKTRSWPALLPGTTASILSWGTTRKQDTSLFG